MDVHTLPARPHLLCEFSSLPLYRMTYSLAWRHNGFDACGKLYCMPVHAHAHTLPLSRFDSAGVNPVSSHSRALPLLHYFFFAGNIEGAVVDGARCTRPLTLRDTP